MSWTQPICSLCYGKREPGRSPVAIVEAERAVERCCLCGQNTKEGIYYRIDPATVPYPKEEPKAEAEPEAAPADPLTEAQRAFAAEQTPPPPGE